MMHKSIHAIWTLPSGDQDQVLEVDTQDRAVEQNSPAARGTRYLAEPLLGAPDQDDEDYRRHVEYCCINPVKHGLVRRVRTWPFSSFHRDAAAGLFPADWAGDFDAVGEFGEA